MDLLDRWALDMPNTTLHEDVQIANARAEAERIAREWAEAAEGNTSDISLNVSLDAPREAVMECVITEEGARRIQKGSRAMNSILTRTENQPGRCQLRTAPTITKTEAREQALARLVNLLEGGAGGYAHEHADNTLECGVELSQLARLRAARASYALATGGGMRRVGRGAWLREEPSQA